MVTIALAPRERKRGTLCRLQLQLGSTRYILEHLCNFVRNAEMRIRSKPLVTACGTVRKRCEGCGVEKDFAI